MPNLFSLIKPRGEKESNQRQNFDLTNGHVYSQKAGIIDVLKAVHTVPKDYFDIDVSDATQTTAMNSAAFLKARKEISAYYVPYNYIWSNFNQYQATREDPKSAALAVKGIAFEPRIPLWVLYSTAAELYYAWIFAEYASKLLALSVFRGSERDLGWLPTSADLDDIRIKNRADQYIEEYLSSVFDDTPNSNFRFLTNNRAGCTIMESEPAHYYLFSEDPDTLVDLYRDVTGNWKWSYWLRKLDMLGYGNLLPIFDAWHRNTVIPMFERVLSDIDEDGTGDEQTITPDVLLGNWFNYSVGSESNMLRSFVRTCVNRLKNMCLSDTTVTVDGIVSSVSKLRMVSVYPLFSYNHIFYHMFRNSYFDLGYDVRNYNVDDLDCSTFEGSIIWWSRLTGRFYELAHHQYKKDMFTGVLPDVQFGVVSKVELGSLDSMQTGSPVYPSTFEGSIVMDSNANTRDLYGRYVGETNGVLFDSGNTNSLRQIRTEHTHPVTISGASSLSFDVLALKRAEMLQVYHQQLMRAGNRTADIFKAIYGGAPKSEMHSTPYFVEVLGEDMNLDPVVATANTGVGDNPNLGDIAARGLFSGSRNLKFSTEDFGCLIFLAYIVPEPFYNSTRIDPHLMNLTPEDHFIPELMNLGFSPVLGEWLCNIGNHLRLNRIRGYAPPYLEFKTDVSLAHGAFASAQVDILSGYQGIYKGSLSHWVSSRIDMQSTGTLSLRQFYINPSVLDPIFKVANDDSYETDQFICRSALVIKSVRQFSALGLPSF